MPSQKPMIGVRLPKQELRAVKKAAEADRRPVSHWVRVAILEKLERTAADGKHAQAE